MWGSHLTHFTYHRQGTILHTLKDGGSDKCFKTQAGTTIWEVPRCGEVGAKTFPLEMTFEMSQKRIHIHTIVNIP